MTRFDWDKAKKNELSKERMESIPSTPRKTKQKPIWRLERNRWAFGGTCGRCGARIAMGEARWVKRPSGELRHERCYTPRA